MPDKNPLDANPYNLDPTDVAYAVRQMRSAINMLNAGELGHAVDSFKRAGDAMERMRDAWLWPNGRPYMDARDVKPTEHK